jgi:hypothetical protein
MRSAMTVVGMSGVSCSRRRMSRSAASTTEGMDRRS